MSYNPNTDPYFRAAVDRQIAEAARIARYNAQEGQQNGGGWMPSFPSPATVHRHGASLAQVALMIVAAPFIAVIVLVQSIERGCTGPKDDPTYVGTAQPKVAATPWHFPQEPEVRRAQLVNPHPHH